MKRVLITDRVHDILIDGLQEHYEVDYRPKMPRAEVLKVVQAYEGLVVNSKVFVDEALASRAAKLRWIGRLGSGLDIIDFEVTDRHGIKVMNSPEGNAPAVAEHVLAMLLSMNRHIRSGHDMVASMKDWDRESVRGSALDGQKVGIYGFGHTGQMLAKRLQGFDVEVAVYDKYLDHYPMIHPNQQIVTAEELLASSDILSLHIPLSEETRGLVDASFLSRFKGHTMVNTSRGAIVKLFDLFLWLKTDESRSACLDVFPNEKVSTYHAEERHLVQSLLDTNRVICTPHVAGWTHSSLASIAKVLLDKILMFIVSV